MSKIGRKPIEIPEGIKVNILKTPSGEKIETAGPKGEGQLILHPKITARISGGKIEIKRKGNDKFSKSLHGLYRQLVKNLILGLSSGFEKKLEIIGVGYRAKVENNTLILNLGFSHPVEYSSPEGITFEVSKNTILVRGTDKQKVGQVAAEIRKIRPPEPYKGKGVKYFDEKIIKKPGKKAVAAAV